MKTSHWYKQKLWKFNEEEYYALWLSINLETFLYIYLLLKCVIKPPTSHWYKEINCEILNIFSGFQYVLLKWNTQQGERLVINVYYKVNPIK